MDHAEHVAEMRNVCQIFNMKRNGKNLEGVFIYGEKILE